jgi:hypothetical protein
MPIRTQNPGVVGKMWQHFETLFLFMGSGRA